jgi:glucose 1-dehydrogenase
MQNRLAIITGGTRGIGRATSLRLARDGWDLVLGYAHDDHTAAATRSEAEALGAECSTVRVDLTTDSGIDELFDAATSRAGQIDAVVNNAGATLHISGLAETSPQTIRRVIDLNLTSAVLVARRAVQHLCSGGVLVNVSSGAATTGAPGEYVHYAAAKAGVDALTKGLALEVAPRGIRVVGVAPGTVDTQVHADAGDPGRPERVARTHPMGRVGRPEEIASVIAFALSADASYVAGTTIRAAGGV